MSVQRTLQIWGVEETLRRYPGLTIRPSSAAALLLVGNVDFTATAPGLETITDTYELAISVSSLFPRETPTVKELARRIDPRYHRLSDGSFCLGSPVRLRLMLARTPTLPAFFEKCVIPYLYGHSFVERHGHLPFGELSHGGPGLIEDYVHLFGVDSISACATMLFLIGMKRRVANKQCCPCGSRRRLGRCHHRTVNRLRQQLGRAWSRAEARWLLNEYPEPVPPHDPKAALCLSAARPRRRDKHARGAANESLRLAEPVAPDLQQRTNDITLMSLAPT